MKKIIKIAIVLPIIIVGSMVALIYYEATKNRVSENEVLQILQNHPYYIAFYEKYPNAIHQDFSYHIPPRGISALTLSAENSETGNKLSVTMMHVPTDSPVHILNVECLKNDQVIKENDTSIEFIKTNDCL